MAFVNERITGADLDRYGIPEIKRRIVPGHYQPVDSCTIDRERGIYLIQAGEHRDEDHRPTDLSGWVFMWHGHELWVEMKELECYAENEGPCRITRQITSLGLMGERVGLLGRTRHMPPELAPRREEILKDLYDALLAYRTSGIHSSEYTTFDLTLDIAEGV